MRVWHTTHNKNRKWNLFYYNGEETTLQFVIESGMTLFLFSPGGGRNRSISMSVET